jgi:putative ATPase
LIALATAPKSNAVTTAIGAAMADVRAGLAGPVPSHLRDSHYAGAKKLAHGLGYVYPHDLAAGVAAQQYAPDAITGREYYQPTTHGAERTIAERLAKIRAALRGEPQPDRELGGEPQPDSPVRGEPESDS